MRLLYAPRRRSRDPHGRLREHHLDATALGGYVLVLFMFILAVKLVFNTNIIMSGGIGLDGLFVSDHPVYRLRTTGITSTMGCAARHGCSLSATLSG